jgi:hypothetical protein
MVTWKKAKTKPVIVEFREVEPKEIIQTLLITDNEGNEEKIEMWGERINTLEGDLYAYPKLDFMMRGMEGELYPIKKRIFYKKYEVIE